MCKMVSWLYLNKHIFIVWIDTTIEASSYAMNKLSFSMKINPERTSSGRALKRKERDSLNVAAVANHSSLNIRQYVTLDIKKSV